MGTGGAARAAIVAASAVCDSVLVYGRNPVKVDALAGEFGINPFIESVTSQFDPIDVVIGCVPSDAQMEFLKQHSECVTAHTAVIEMAYIPKITPLVAHAESVGSKHIVHGSEVLLLQGIEQHGIWVRSLIEREEIDNDSLSQSPVDVHFVRQQLEKYTNRN